MPEDIFGIVVVAKSKHGDLWDACKTYGSQSGLARYLKLNPAELGYWVNLKKCPSRNHPRREELEGLLLLATGKTWEELWPDELLVAVKGGNLAKQIELRKEVEYRALAEMTQGRNLLPAPDESLIHAQEMEELSTLVDTLSPRLKEIIERRFGLNGMKEMTLKEIGEILGISQGRVRQLSLRAIGHLRKRAKQFAPSLSTNDD